MHRYFDVNAVGPLLMSQACCPHLRDSEWRGRIINVASRTFFTGNPGQLAYIASKGALMGMTRVLAHELGEDRITVNAVMPAQVATPEPGSTPGRGLREDHGEAGDQEFVTPSHFA